jgi:DNA gyrase subunit B
MTKKLKYDESSVTYFHTDTAKIRAKPQMYIGPTDSAGLMTILRECLDNAVDEARAGRNDSIRVFQTKKSFVVVDSGIGIPVGIHKIAKKSTLTVVLTSLQSGGKMDGKAYTSSIGTHGVGLKATNALSKEFQVWTFRDGKWHTTRFEKGKETLKVSVAKAPKLPDGTRPKKGTVIEFVPDETIFGKAKFNEKDLFNWAELTAYLNAKLPITYSRPDGKSKTWVSKNGIQDYLKKRVADLKCDILGKPIFVNLQNVELIIGFSDAEGCNVEFFTNTIRNIECGVHADAMFRALNESLKPYKGRSEFTPTDVKEGLLGLLNYKVDAPRFDSQTKEKLVDERVGKPCYETCLHEFQAFWKAHKSLAKQVCQRAAELRKKTDEFLKDKRLIKKIKAAKKTLPAKLAMALKCPAENRELYLVEGDSAGGTAKQARFKDFQEVWPMKGKIVNAMRESKAKIVNSEEVAGILASVGLDMSTAHPMQKLRVGYVMYLADPDVDGFHINCLLLTLFWEYLPDLIKEGRVFVVSAPEYLARYKNRTYFGMTKEIIYKQTGSDKVTVQHIKGWGEISSTDMREIAFSRENRRLWKVMPPIDKNGKKEFQLLMGADSGYRKKLLNVV